MSAILRTKEFVTKRRTQLTVSFISLINYLMLTIGVISPAWVSYSRDVVLHVSHVQGIWAECAFVEDETSYCESWDTSSISGTIKTCQALGVLAFLLSTCAVIGVIIHVLHEKKILFRFIFVAICFLFFVSGLLVIISSAVFDSHLSKTRDVTTTTAWAGIINYVSGVTSLIIGAYFTAFYILKHREFVQNSEDKMDYPLVVVKEKNPENVTSDRNLPPLSNASKRKSKEADAANTLAKNKKLPPISK